MTPFDPRPHRLSQIYQDYHPPLYYVTFCTEGRRPVLACDEVHQAFVHYSGKALEISAVAVGRYVIMPDHVHLFVRGPDGFKLGVWIRGLKRRLSQAIKQVANQSAAMCGADLCGADKCGADKCGADVPIRLDSGGADRRMGTSAPHEGTDRRMGTSAPHEGQDRRMGTSAPQQDQGLWQEGLFDHIIRHSESYREKWAYVWQNPVRAELVKNAADWPYQGEITLIDRA